MAIYDAPESLHAGTGVETVFGFNWPYLLPRDLVVTVNGQPVPTVLASPNQVVVAPAPAALSIVRIYRNTPAQYPTYLFATGIPMLPKYIDGNNKQLLYALQEGLLQFAQTQATADAALEAATAAQVAAAEAAASAAQQAANIRRTLRVAGTDPELPTLPAREFRSSRVLGFDSLGDPVLLPPQEGSASDVALALADHTNPSKGAGMVALPAGFVRDAIKYVTPEMYGAVGDGITDDSAALAAAFTRMGATGEVCYLSAGKTYISTGYTDVSNQPVNVAGAGTIQLRGPSAYLQFRSVAKAVSLAAPVPKGSRSITVTDTSGILPGSLIYVGATAPVCVDFPTIGAQQVFTVAGRIGAPTEAAIVGNVVTVLEESQWSFAATDTGHSATLYSVPRKVTWHDASIVRESPVSEGIFHMHLLGATLDLHNLRIRQILNVDPDVGPDGLLANRSVGYIRGSRLDGVRYGLNIGAGSSNVQVLDTYGRACRHVVYLNGWANGTIVRGLRGDNNNALMDGHACLHTTYSEVYTDSDRGFSNMRGDGGLLRNVHIATQAFSAGTSFRFAAIQWLDAYAEQRNTRDMEFSNVELRAPATYTPSDGIGFQVNFARTLTLRDVRVYPSMGVILGGLVGSITEVRVRGDCNLNLAPTSQSIVRGPMSATGGSGEYLPAVLSGDRADVVVYPYGVYGDRHIRCHGTVFSDTVSVAERSVRLRLYLHTRPLNYLNLASVQGTLRLHVTSNGAVASEYTLPLRFNFTGSALGGTVGTLTGTPSMGALIPVTLGSIVSGNTNRLWYLELPLTLQRQSTNQVYALDYTLEAYGRTL